MGGDGESTASAEGDEDCEAAAAAMREADPDLDPVWGLLVGDATCTDNPERVESPVCVDGQIAKGASGTGRSAEVMDSAQALAVGLDSACFAATGPPATPALQEEAYRQGGEDCQTVHAAKQRISDVVDKDEVAPENFALPDDEDLPPPRRWDIDGCDAFVLDGVLSKRECDSIMEQAEHFWSFWDDAERPKVEFRNAHTIEVTHRDLAARIWRRVSSLVNPAVSMCKEDERFEVDIGGTWRPYAMNPTLLLSRYLCGGHFSPHTDGTTVVDFNRRTFYSCVLFLNKSPWGGHTRLYADSQLGRELVSDGEGRLTGDDPSLVLAEVAPEAGRMLVFYHRTVHEGAPAAEKYIVRTDVLYHREPELCTAPEDVEAFAMYQEAQLRAERGECAEAAGLFRRAFKRSSALAKVYGM